MVPRVKTGNPILYTCSRPRPAPEVRQPATPIDGYALHRISPQAPQPPGYPDPGSPRLAARRDRQYAPPEFRSHPRTPNRVGAAPRTGTWPLRRSVRPRAHPGSQTGSARPKTHSHAAGPRTDRSFCKWSGDQNPAGGRGSQQRIYLKRRSMINDQKLAAEPVSGLAYFINSWIARMISCSFGMASASSARLYGIGTSSAATRITGASSS